MQLLNTVALCTLLVAGIRSETESHITSSLYKDQGHHDYVQQFHHGQPHGQPHGSEVVSNGGSVAHLVPNSQVQDQSSVQDHVSHPVGHIGQIGQVGAVGQGPSPVSPVGPIHPASGHISQLVPVPYIGQKPDFPVHAGARAIGAPVPVPYFGYYGKTYASPVYGQYQPVPHQAVNPQVYPYSVTPYSALPYSGVPVPTPAVYPGYSGYNYPYYPQYIPGVPFYNQQSGEVQLVNKQ